MGLTFLSLGDTVQGSSFATKDGDEEFHITVRTNEGTDFNCELEALYESYTNALHALGLTTDTQTFSRFYIGDIVNQKELLVRSRVFETARLGAVSVVQQCPVNGGSVVLYAYHVRRGGLFYPKEIICPDVDGWRNGALVRGRTYSLLYAANLTGGGIFDSCAQATEVFGAFNALLNERGMTLYDNAVRTWVYVRDIDNHYRGMVEARKSFFLEHGLTSKTKYISSTGIEGSFRDVNALVQLDALAIGGLCNEQFVRMEALDHLSPTIRYGVTFERGMRIRFGDRSHLYISGTASIDHDGRTLYASDVRRQTHRTIENVKALLASQGAGLTDMACLVCYLRDFKDEKRVMDIVREEIPPDIPCLYVIGAVCRPGWLVEFEGVGIIPDRTDFPPFL